MGSLSLEEIKKVELDALCELDRVCKAHGLSYFLAYGTLLGALRHQGFIPWDDDVDVHMPREDYERFYGLCRDGALRDPYRITSYRDGSSIYGFLKLVDTRTVAKETFIDEKNAQGLWVDVFPLERVDITDPGLPRVRRRAARLLWWRSIAATDPRYARSTAARLVKRVIHPFTRRLDQYGIARKADRLAQSANATGRVEPGNLRYLVLVDDCAEFMPEDFSDARRAPFEGCAFDVPVGAERVLEGYYGDWRRVPPAEERPPAHLREVTWVAGAVHD